MITFAGSPAFSAPMDGEAWLRTPYINAPPSTIYPARNGAVCGLVECVAVGVVCALGLSVLATFAALVSLDLGCNTMRGRSEPLVTRVAGD